MVKIAPFSIEEWMDEHEPSAKYNLAETCVASISLNDLQALTAPQSGGQCEFLNNDLKLTYGPIRGTEGLRTNLAALYADGIVTYEDILVTNGAIAANYLVLRSIVSEGDHVICQYPTYEQLCNVPASFGAQISLWKMDPENSWSLCTAELEQLLRSNTKMIVLNNPNNPTGTLMSNQQLESVVAIAKARNISILCDEVYRPLYHSIRLPSGQAPISAIDTEYERVIVTGSLSKAYSLAGIRLGWITTRDKVVLEKIAAARHYTTISVSLLDQAVATQALSRYGVRKLLQRNIDLARANLKLLTDFVKLHDQVCSWVLPAAGTTAMIQFKKGGVVVNDEQFCKLLIETSGVLLAPASRCFGRATDFQGYIRIGFVPETSVLQEGLNMLALFLKEYYHLVPVISDL